MNYSRLRDPKSFVGLFAIALMFGTSSWMEHGPFNKEFRGLADENHPLVMPDLQFKLTEVSQETGVMNHHQGYQVHPTLKGVEPYLSAVGASVAVVDYDNDGWPDIYLNNSAVGSKNHLFRNNHDGTFTDIAEEAGIADVNSPNPSTRAIFFDVNNNGHKDLFLLSYCPRLFLNQGDGTFKEVTKTAGFGCGYFYGGLNLIDYDEDGYLDLVFAPYLSQDIVSDPKSTEVMPNNLHLATNGEGVTLFHNNGNGTFTKIQTPQGIEHRGWTHTIGVYDIRGTGRPDLWFPTDYGTDRLSLNLGGGKFEDSSQSLDHGIFSRNGMGIEFGDIDDDGHISAYVSHIYHAGQKLTGNVLWKWIQGNQFRDISRERGVESCGWSWGSKFVDFDNNGKLDLFVGNGFISSNVSKTYWYSLSVLDAADGNILKDIKNWAPMKDMSLAGYQRPCLFLNNGNHFTNVTNATSLISDRSDERGVATIDYLNNGSQSLIIANQKQPSTFYQNEQLNSHSWIGFKLHGTRSNRDAIGAKVTLQLENKTLSRQLQPLNGYSSQSDDRIHFGLGKHPRIHSIIIDWPSHTRQAIDTKNLSLNRYHTIYEPTH